MHGMLDAGMAYEGSSSTSDGAPKRRQRREPRLRLIYVSTSTEIKLPPPVAVPPLEGPMARLGAGLPSRVRKPISDVFEGFWQIRIWSVY